MWVWLQFIALWCWATILCGRLATMDSVPAPKATYPMKLRNLSNWNTRPGTRKPRPTKDTSLIAVQRILMLRMPGLQHCVAGQLPWIQPLLQKQFLWWNSEIVQIKILDLESILMPSLFSITYSSDSSSNSDISITFFNGMWFMHNTCLKLYLLFRYFFLELMQFLSFYIMLLTVTSPTSSRRIWKGIKLN